MNEQGKFNILLISDTCNTLLLFFVKQNFFVWNELVEEKSFTQISKFNFLMEKCNLHCLKSHFYRIAASKVPLTIIDMFVIYHKEKVSLINHKNFWD